MSDQQGHRAPAIRMKASSPTLQLNGYANVGEYQPAPPHNFEAEQALLGAIVLKNEVHGHVADFVHPAAPERAADTRVSLAHAHIAHAAAGDRDPECLAATALEAVKNNPPRARTCDS